MKKSWYKRIKRLQDILLSGIALIVLGPLMGVIGLVIWLDDPHGGFLYKQIRCGLHGRHFCMYKFRTMHVNADQQKAELQEANEMDGPAFKIKADPRLTKVGAILRSTGLDELPQFWNVLRGEMSIVGPRPPLPDEVRMYEKAWLGKLHVPQGMTCYWQITPKRNEMRFEDWMALDLKYVKERSFLVDWGIIFKTFGTVWRRDGL